MFTFSLNPCCSGRWSRTRKGCSSCDESEVLILVVVDDGLVHHHQELKMKVLKRLNPCCSGRWSRTATMCFFVCGQVSLNPCCSGRWSRTNTLV